ncbi:MAG: GldG family protein, partial [Chitinophagaceae bacterium]
MNVFSVFWHKRWDLTADKRFTLSQATRQALNSLKGEVKIQIYLDGKLPAGFRELKENTRELLEEFQVYGHGHIKFHFSQPAENIPDSLKQKWFDSLAANGIRPFNLQVQLEASEGYSEKLIYPGALVSYQGKTLAVNLLSGQSGGNDEEALNKGADLLEYKFAEAIHHLEQKNEPLVGYLLGNGEPTGWEIYDALNTIHDHYELDTLNLLTEPYIPPEFKAMVIVKPILAFTDTEKLKLDQYVMNGGKLFWCVGGVNADMDSLQNQNSFIAFNRGLNL